MRFALILALLVACRGKANSGAPCSAVATQFFALARTDLDTAKVAPETRRQVLDQLPAMRDALSQACTDGAWSAQVRDCIVNARDHAAFQACEQQLTDDQRKALDRAALDPAQRK